MTAKKAVWPLKRKKPTKTRRTFSRCLRFATNFQCNIKRIYAKSSKVEFYIRIFCWQSIYTRKRNADSANVRVNKRTLWIEGFNSNYMTGSLIIAITCCLALCQDNNTTYRHTESNCQKENTNVLKRLSVFVC